MLLNYRQELVRELATALKSYGFKVYVSKSGTHGFYTDGVRVVSFQCPLGMLTFSGNYSTSLPKQTGTGWALADVHGIPNKATATAMVQAFAPSWAVGTAEVHYSTPESHLKSYGASSGYTEFEVDG